MSDVLHAMWLPALQRLFVWGEAGAGAPRKGRKAQLPVHPFQLAPARLREIGGPPPPGVLMTAYAADEHVRAATEAGSFALIHKPVPAQRLLDVVAQATAA